MPFWVYRGGSQGKSPQSEDVTADCRCRPGTDIRSCLPRSRRAPVWDALTQLIEPFVSSRANAITDLYCREGLRRVAAVAAAEHIKTVRMSKLGPTWRTRACSVDWRLANAGLGYCPRICCADRRHVPCASRRVCAALLPHGMRTNVRCATGTCAGSSVAGALLADRCDPHGWRSSRRCDHVGLGALPGAQRSGSSLLRLKGTHVEDLAAKAAAASSMKANPIVLTSKELIATLEAAL